MIKILSVLLLLCSFAINGCISTHYTSANAPADLKAKPDFEDYVPGYLLGIIKESRPVDTNKVCAKGEPWKIRKGKTTEDVLLSFFSLGLYWPHTLQVWCPQDK